jgi:hypothetical protein
LGFGVAGVARDERKLYAIVAIIIAGALVAYYLLASGMLG